MGLNSTWQRFQASPSTQQLASDATLTYVTSCKQLQGPRDIINQLAINSKGFKQHKDEVVAVHETIDSLVVELVSSFAIDFEGKLNPLMPGFDDNMFAGKTVQVPMIQSVKFAQGGEKIQSIRVFWDQATVLKQIEVIGARGRGWPVFDGIEQCRLLRAVGKFSSMTSAAPASTQAPDNDRPLTATNDPHASLSLFNKQPETPRENYDPIDVPESCKPDRREYDELFVNADSARTDDAVARSGRGALRQVSLTQTQQASPAPRAAPSEGQRQRESHFEFDTVGADKENGARDRHVKGAVKDHNHRAELDTPEQAVQHKPRPDQKAHFEYDETSKAGDNVHGREFNMGRRGPPSAQFAFTEENAAPADSNVHGREYNMTRRPPPQAQFAFTEANEAEGNVHGREYNMGRRAPPQAQFAFTEPSEPEGNIHGREYNMGRRAPPSAQYAFTEETETQAGENIHGREYNMGRRAPPQAQFDFVADANGASAPRQEQAQSHGVAHGQRDMSSQFHFEEDDKSATGASKLHGRDYNMGRRGPPSASWSAFGDDQPIRPASSSSAANSNSNGTAQQEEDNIHGRRYNMSRRPPPQAQFSFGDAANPDEEDVHNMAFNKGRRGPPAPSAGLW